MKTQSLLAQALGMFTNRQAGTKRGKKTMKVFVSVFTLMVLGMSTHVYAGAVAKVMVLVGHLERVITYEDKTNLLMSGGNSNGCGSRYFTVYKDSDEHDHVFALFNMAWLTNNELEIQVKRCEGNAAIVDWVAILTN